MLQVKCRALTPDNLTELVEFMERTAFVDNPTWSSCYCVFHYLTDAEHGDWAQRSGESNRRALVERVHTQRGQWILAYRDDQIVGWVNADMRPVLRRYDEWETLASADTGMVACFVVDPQWRRRGVARQLLDAAVDALWAQGAERVDAWLVEKPTQMTQDGTTLGADQMAHHGPLAMYLDAGFGIIGRQRPFVHVRRDRPPYTY